MIAAKNFDHVEERKKNNLFHFEIYEVFIILFLSFAVLNGFRTEVKLIFQMLVIIS